MFKHGIEDHEQLAHGGSEREFGRLTGAAQPLIWSYPASVDGEGLR
jgi:hypothetical protein